MTIIDLTIVNVSLPTIGHELHFTETSLQWVVTAYALTFGGFMLLGGRAADLLGLQGGGGRGHAVAARARPEGAAPVDQISDRRDAVSLSRQDGDRRTATLGPTAGLAVRPRPRARSGTDVDGYFSEDPESARSRARTTPLTTATQATPAVRSS